MNSITVYTNSGSGLANRLIAIGEAQWLAKLYNRTVNVIWVSSPLCTMTFQGFYQQTNINQVYETTDQTKIATLDFLVNKSKKTILFSDTPELQLRYQNKCTIVAYTNAISKSQLPTGEEDWIFDVSCGLIEDKSPTDYAAVFGYCSQLKLKDHIRQQVTDQWNTYFKTHGPVVGLHIRRQSDDKQWNAIFGKSPTITYVKVAQHLKQLLPGVKFFIATLDNEVETAIKFGIGEDSVITSPKTKWERDSVEGMREAVIELYLLAQCDYLLLNNGSTYGWLAQALGSKQALIVSEINDPALAAERIFSAINIAEPIESGGKIVTEVLTMETGKRVNNNQCITAWTQNLVDGAQGLPVYYDHAQKTFACKLEKQIPDPNLIVAIPVVPPSWTTIDVTEEFKFLYLEFKAKVEQIESSAGLMAKVSMGDKDQETRLAFTIDNNYKLTNQWSLVSIPIRYFSHEVGDITRRDLRTVQFVVISNNVVHLADIKLVSKAK